VKEKEKGKERERERERKGDNDDDDSRETRRVIARASSPSPISSLPPVFLTFLTRYRETNGAMSRVKAQRSSKLAVRDIDRIVLILFIPPMVNV